MKSESKTNPKKGIKLKNKSENKPKIIEKNLKDILNNVKNDYILLEISSYLERKKFLKIFKYNKKIQKRLQLSLNNYKEYIEIFSPIEIELKITKPKPNELDKFLQIIQENENPKLFKFINIIEDQKKYHHIYFNNNKTETERNNLNENDKISKIKIIIDYQVKSFQNLFKDCECIETITFKKFYRNNIINLSSMFEGCSSLKVLNLSKFNTTNVRSMKNLFLGCYQLEELNLSKFNTDNVSDMQSMFNSCSSLKELNLSNFNTDNVVDMSYMFNKCSSLVKINLSNFNTENVFDMECMFYDCSSLKELNLSNFNTINVTNMRHMFYQCLELKVLNISNFDTNKVKDMCSMFSKCYSLKELNLSNFKSNNETKMGCIFDGINKKLKIKIKAQKKFKQEAFE